MNARLTSTFYKVINIFYLVFVFEVIAQIYGVRTGDNINVRGDDITDDMSPVR